MTEEFRSETKKTHRPSDEEQTVTDASTETLKLNRITEH
jgi:hypothetical protein